MKLAEALSERADIQKRIQQLRSRLRRNALVQEGKNPPRILMHSWRSTDASARGMRSSYAAQTSPMPPRRTAAKR